MLKATVDRKSGIDLVMEGRTSEILSDLTILISKSLVQISNSTNIPKDELRKVLLASTDFWEKVENE